MDKRLQSDFRKYQRKQFKNSLNDLLPKSLIPVIIELSQIPPDKQVHQITRTERFALIRLLKQLTLTIANTLPLSSAIVTAGGVSTAEINPKTMESKLIKGLYAGELILMELRRSTAGSLFYRKCSRISCRTKVNCYMKRRELKLVRAVRGAITVDKNDAGEIIEVISFCLMKS